MSSEFGNAVRIIIEGEAHSPEISATLTGIPVGEAVDIVRLQAFMKRRQAKLPFETARREDDELSVEDSISDNGRIKITIKNTKQQSSDYDKTRLLPRPSHADYPAFVKYGFIPDGGGAFSGRMTAALCAAGGVCLQILERRGVFIGAHIHSIGKNEDLPFCPTKIDKSLFGILAASDFPVISPAAGKKMLAEIDEYKRKNDSLGGVIECCALGLPVGTGGALFDGIESALSAAVFAIPAVKAIEFGSGFASARLSGSENNDEFYFDAGIKTFTNNAGGILGGMVSGMPLIFRCAFKPVASIGLPQKTVNLKTNESETLTIFGRHDSCFVARAVPVVEAAAAVALLDKLISEEKAHGRA